MSGHYKNITGYSASDIEKYRKGELSAREMHELEKAALEDPFLADALEGMEVHRGLYEPAVFDKDKEDLHARLAARAAEKDGKRRVLLPRVWMRWAAVVIGLIGMGTIAIYSISGHSKMNVDKERITSTAARKEGSSPEDKTPAAEATQPPAAGGASGDSIRLAAPASDLLTAKGSSRKEDDLAAQARTSHKVASHKQNVHKESFRTETMAWAKADTSATGIRIDSGRSLNGFLTQNEPKKAEFRKQTPAPAPVYYLPATTIRAEGKRYDLKKDTVEYSAGLFAAKPQAAVGSNNLAKDVAASPNNVFRSNAETAVGATPHFKLPPAPAFTGKVLDEHDRPLEGAAVYLSGHRNINTTTDRTGQFRLPLQPKDSSQKLLIQYVGYAQTAIDLARIDPDALNSLGNIIRLQPESPSLDEVTITGFGSKRRETLTTLNHTEGTDSLWTKASPTIGKWAYVHYLQTAARKQSVDSAIKGIEIISFIVNKKGSLSSFKIEQSLSPAHDASTIRLIQEGPAWQLLHGHEIRASVRVVY